MAMDEQGSNVFFDVKVGVFKAGRIEMKLFHEDCPITASNFMHLCLGDRGLGKTTGHPLHYKGCKIHRVVRGFVVQGGDFSKGDGTGGESIYGGKFRDENFKHRHTGPGLLSMANSGKDSNGSQFFITLAPAPHLDGKHVVFGAVTAGMDIVRKLEVMENGARGSPVDLVTITDCGVVEEHDGTPKRRDRDEKKERNESKKHKKDNAKKEEKKVEKLAKKEAKAEKKALKKEAKAKQREVDSRPADWVDPSQLSVVTADREADGRHVKGRGNLRYGDDSPGRRGDNDRGGSRVVRSPLPARRWSRERRAGDRRERSRPRDDRERSRPRDRRERSRPRDDRERSRPRDDREGSRSRDRRERSRPRDDREGSRSRDRRDGDGGRSMADRSRERKISEIRDGGDRSRSRSRDRGQRSGR